MVKVRQQDLIERLEASGLLKASAIEKIKASAPEEMSATKLARKLVDKEALTIWQAQQLIAGNTLLKIGNFALQAELHRNPSCITYRALGLADKREVRLELLRGGDSPGVVDLEQMTEQLRKLKSLSHPTFLRACGAKAEEEMAYVATPVPSDAVSAYNLTGQQRLARRQIAEVIRHLAVAISHAHEAEVFDPTWTPSNLLMMGTTRPRLMYFGLSSIRPSVPEWDFLDDDESQGSDEFAQRRRDIQRLGRIGLFLLHGTPNPDSDMEESVRSKSRLDRVFYKMLNTSPDGKLQKMEDVVRLITRWEKANRVDESEEPDGGQALSEMDEAIRALEGIGDSQTASSRAEVDFNLTPARTEPDTEDASDSAEAIVPRKRLKLPPKLMIAGTSIAMLLVVIVTVIIMVNALTGGSSGASTSDDDREVAKADDKTKATPTPAKDADDSDAQRDENPTADDDSAATADGAGAGNDDDPAANRGNAADNGNNAQDVAANDGNEIANPDVSADANAPPGNTDDPLANAGVGNDTEPPAEQPAGNNNAANNADEETASTGDPEPPQRTFANIPRLIELPALGEPNEPIPGYDDPVVVGPLKLVENDLLIVDLLGGDTAYKGKFDFDLLPFTGAVTAYDGIIRMGERGEGGLSRQDVARLYLEGGQLKFQWLPAATTEVASNYLRNCMIVLRTGTDVAPLALRKPVEIAPLEINPQSGSSRTETQFEWAPRVEVVKFKLMNAAPEFPNFQFRENINTASASRGRLYCDFFETNSFPVFAEIESSLRNKFVANYDSKVIYDGRPEPYRTNVAQRHLKDTQDAQLVIQAQIDQYNRLPNDQKNQLKDTKRNLDLGLTQARQTAEKLRRLISFMEQFQGEKIPLRVYIDLEDYQVDLATPDGQPSDGSNEF